MAALGAARHEAKQQSLKQQSLLHRPAEVTEQRRGPLRPTNVMSAVSLLDRVAMEIAWLEDFDARPSKGISPARQNSAMSPGNNGVSATKRPSAGYDIGRGSEHGILWTPVTRTGNWLTGFMQKVFETLQVPFNVPVRAIPHGHRIYGIAEQPLHLDGELYFHVRESTRIRCPSSAGRKGGDFALPFFAGRSS